MKAIKLFISLYTDQDWCFKSKDGLIDYAEYFDGEFQYHFAFETLHPSDGKFYVPDLLSTDEYERNFKPSDEHQVPYLTVEEFLTQLKEDLYYGDSNGWIREQFDAMVDGAIEFLKKGEPGVYYGSLKDGNWQPSGLFIVIEERKTVLGEEGAGRKKPIKDITVGEIVEYCGERPASPRDPSRCDGCPFMNVCGAFPVDLSEDILGEEVDI